MGNEIEKKAERNGCGVCVEVYSCGHRCKIHQHGGGGGVGCQMQLWHDDDDDDDDEGEDTVGVESFTAQ